MRLRAFRPRRRGIATTELALVLPLLCFLFVVVMDFCRIFYFSVTVTNCARNGAYYGCSDPKAANDVNGIKAMAQIDAKNLNAQLLTVTSATDSSTEPTYVDVTVSYPFTTLTRYPGVPSQVPLSRTVRMQVVPWTPQR